jgi:cytosine/adenosine deaminase-related metal-dependent hydrolase
MSYRKFTAPRIFTGTEFLSIPAVVITSREGKIIEIVDPGTAGDDVEFFEGILCPGFVNCHAHLELSHMRGKIPEGTGLVEFVISVVNERHIDEDEILDAIRIAEEEMKNNGIVAVGDICNNLLTIPRKSEKNLYYHNFIEASGYPPALAKSRFERSFEYYLSYGRVGPASIVPHAPYSVSDELFEMIIDLPGNDLLSIHNQETIGEDEWMYKKTGELQELYDRLKIDTGHFNPRKNSGLKHFVSRTREDQQLILVHNVHTTPGDIEFTKTRSNPIFWCLCPNANLYISGRLPDVELFLGKNCRIVLGTDSLASNHSLDILSEIREIREKFPAIPDETVLTWVTSNGAAALKCSEELGGLEIGKMPGLVLIDNEFSKARRLV